MDIRGGVMGAVNLVQHIFLPCKTNFIQINILLRAKMKLNFLLHVLSLMYNVLNNIN